jgi:uncharacterized phage-associated protein
VASAMEVARYFAHNALNDEEPDYLTHLRLQKLLYYAQAWSLVMRDKSLFPERIEAWVHGPVVREVFDAFKAMGTGPIAEDAIGEPVFDLTDDEKDFVRSVWDSYKGYSALKLREMTQEEDPWINARGRCAAADRSNSEITLDALRDYFTVPIDK